MWRVQHILVAADSWQAGGEGLSAACIKLITGATALTAVERAEHVRVVHHMADQLLIDLLLLLLLMFLHLMLLLLLFLLLLLLLILLLPALAQCLQCSLDVAVQACC